ncbi:hypothetical protein FO519_003767 [Halicephalobus sp. NKZ332]|nr:hypothetical protein FO519_003767 [Halicephalobus sp. NKZ332]
MLEFSSSDDINSYDVDCILSAVVKVKSVALVPKYNRTYINFLTSDGLDGTAYCRELCEFKTKKGDFVSLGKVKMDRNKGPKNNLKYDLILLQTSEATVIYTDNMKVEIKIYPQTGLISDDLIASESERKEEESDRDYSVNSSDLNKKNTSICGTLLKDFEITRFENEDNETESYYKSIILTEKGEEIPVVVNMEVQLPIILHQHDKISVEGFESEIDGVQGRFIMNKYQIFYEGVGDSRNQRKIKENQQSPEKLKIKIPPKLPPKPIKIGSTPVTVSGNRNESPLIVGYEGYTFAFVNNFFFNYLSVEWLTVLMTFWLFSYINLVCALPLQFFYRYLLICREKSLSDFYYVIILLLSLLLNLPFCVTIYFGQKFIVSQNITAAIPGINMKPAILLVPSSIYFFLCHGMSMIVYIVVYSIIIYCSVAVYKKMKSKIDMVTKDMRSTQSQISRVMVTQALIPSIAQLLPVLSIFLASSLPNFDVVLLSFPSCVLLATIGSVNALSVLLIIKGYRNIVFHFFLGSMWSKESSTTKIIVRPSVMVL